MQPPIAPIIVAIIDSQNMNEFSLKPIETRTIFRMQKQTANVAKTVETILLPNGAVYVPAKTNAYPPMVSLRNKDIVYIISFQLNPHVLVRLKPPVYMLCPMPEITQMNHIR